MKKLFKYSKSKIDAKGFTILEIGIVILVIGLILGGVFAGQEILKTSRQNSLIADIRQYQTAINTFELNYDYKPGDMRNATEYWGTDSGGCPSGSNNNGTCNGNGDGVVSTSEFLRVWEHLSFSELVKTKYVYDGLYLKSGISSPETDYINSTISYGACAEYFDLSKGRKKLGKNTNVFGFQINNENDPCSHGGHENLSFRTGLKVDDAMAIDVRIDDGIASSGKLLGFSCINDSSGTKAGSSFDEIEGLDDDFFYEINTNYECSLIFVPKNNK